MEQREDQKSDSDANDKTEHRTINSPTMDLRFVNETEDGADLDVEGEEEVYEQNLIFPERAITIARMSVGLEIASALGLAYRFGLDPTFRDLYLWPANPTITDPLFWHARGSHIHILFDRDEQGHFLPDRAIMTLRHVDDIGTVQPMDGRPLGGAFHFDLETCVQHARSRIRHMFAEAQWFWTNRRDGAGAAWRGLSERDVEAYLADWDGLLEAFGGGV
ncbi:hypothetical protein MMC17_008148 [Xylographa soralifera]|nr:hypothetical protein [Xylographa soralifera]